MSAAATAAGYLYASGRLRGRGAREQNEAERTHEARPPATARREVKVAAYRRQGDESARERRDEPQERGASAPRRVPKVQYRTRRWRPE